MVAVPEPVNNRSHSPAAVDFQHTGGGLLLELGGGVRVGEHLEERAGDRRVRVQSGFQLAGRGGGYQAAANGAAVFWWAQ